MTTIAAALSRARQQIPITEARLLLRHLLGYSAAHIEAHRDDVLDADALKNFEAMVERRHQGEPIAYLTQSREFYGRDFMVARGVLIPRPETELIVDVVLEKYGRDAELHILDMGTGSGCLAITLALELPRAAVTALDISPDTLAIAKVNAEKLRAKVRWLRSDWFAAIANERFDVIVSNPPYIRDGDLHLRQGDLRFEPSCALASGTDGLDAIRTIVEGARNHLNPDGWLFFEHGHDQGQSARELLEAACYRDIVQYRDIAGIVLMSGGRILLA